jgi:hypothetical protein
MKVRLNYYREPFATSDLGRQGPWISVILTTFQDFVDGVSHRADSGIAMEEPRGTYLRYLYSHDTGQIKVDIYASGPYELASISVGRTTDGTLLILERHLP